MVCSMDWTIGKLSVSNLSLNTTCFSAVDLVLIDAGVYFFCGQKECTSAATAMTFVLAVDGCKDSFLLVVWHSFFVVAFFLVADVGLLFCQQLLSISLPVLLLYAQLSHPVFQGLFSWGFLSPQHLLF